MPIIMYDLAGQDGRRFSPYCWRAKMALAHKALDVETRETTFTDIKLVCGGGQKTLPVIDDNGWIVADSFEIALYLDKAHPDAPTLFGGEGGVAGARFMEGYANTVVTPILARMCMLDVHNGLVDADKEYFRATREKRFGMSLEQVQEGREDRIEALYNALTPVRYTLQKQAWLGGETPLFNDYILFGSLQWVRVMSAFQVLKDDDPVRDWFQRLLDLHDGLGASMPAAA